MNAMLLGMGYIAATTVMSKWVDKKWLTAYECMSLSILSSIFVEVLK